MSNFCFPFGDFSNSTQASIADIRSVDVIGSSANHAISVYLDSYTGDIWTRKFYCLANGSRLGPAMASLVDEKTVSQIPTKYSAHATKGAPKYALFLEPIAKNRVTYELVYGDFDDPNNQHHVLFATDHELRAAYTSLLESPPKSAYMLRHYFETPTSLTSTSSYEPLHGM